MISKYVHNPHLIDGYKYDLRIYVLVTCFDPLRIFLFKEGLARFATEKYTNNSKFLNKRYIHLTNYSVNKHGDGFIQNKLNKNQEDEEDGASKWNLQMLKHKFE